MFGAIAANLDRSVLRRTSAPKTHAASVHIRWPSSCRPMHVASVWEGISAVGLLLKKLKTCSSASFGIAKRGGRHGGGTSGGSGTVPSLPSPKRQANRSWSHSKDHHRDNGKPAD